MLMFDRKQQNSVKQLSINKKKKSQRSTGDMQQKGTKNKFRQDWSCKKGPGPEQSQIATRKAPGNCLNFQDHKKFYWIVLFRVSHASDTSSEHHMNQLRPAVGAGTGGGVNAQVLIQWIWSGARVFAFSSGPQLIVMSLVEGWHFENH